MLQRSSFISGPKLFSIEENTILSNANSQIPSNLVMKTYFSQTFTDKGLHFSRFGDGLTQIFVTKNKHIQLKPQKSSHKKDDGSCTWLFKKLKQTKWEQMLAATFSKLESVKMGQAIYLRGGSYISSA